MIDPNLYSFATARQSEYLESVEKHGTCYAAAKALGVNRRTVERALKALRRKAALRGYSPEHDMTRPTAEPYIVKGTSTLYDAETGEPKLQWVKTAADREEQAAMLSEAAEAMAETIPRAKPVKAPKATVEALLNQYTVTDYHLGMLAWAEETRRDDWDATIAENLLVDWFATAIQQAPDAEVGLFAQLGDFLHYDSLESVTPESRHVLDADTRFQGVVRVAIRAFRRVIGMLLEKHAHVYVIMAEGNHDPASSIWLRELFSALYEDEPRITVDKSPDPYYCFEWGQTSLFFHHGHKRKPTNIDDVFVAKFREVFGRTKYSYAHMGHLHHIDVKETNLMIVEQHRTLAAPDAYATRGGWMAGRDAKVITYHQEFGEVGRITVSPDMLKAAA